MSPTLATASLSPRFIQRFHADAAAARAELVAGLCIPRATIAPKWFYDALGSRLFDAITELTEYTATRTEAGVLAAQREAIAAALGSGRTLVDLGAGNCEKAGRLFATLRPARYVAVDISVDFLRRALDGLQRQHPRLEMLGVGLDFSHALELPAEAGDEPRTLFYPGSSIGNFTPEAALGFLRRARAGSPGSNLLVGVDLVKDRRVLEAAYDDALGVTAAFNLNVLRHVNRVLGSDFALADWRHVALFNEGASRIEMHLEARRSCVVTWPGGVRRFGAGERIHSENSYKYTIEAFDRLLHDAGYVDTRCWTDPQRSFAVFAAA